MRMPFECDDKRPCFARYKGRCRILIEKIEGRDCPFCKQYREVTNGVFYADKEEAET